MKRSVHIGLTAGMLACVGFTAADVNNTAQLFINPAFAGGSGPFSFLEIRPGRIEASGSTTGGANSSGSVSVMVDYGLIDVTGDGSGGLSDLARGIFRDRLIITAPGIPTNTPGTLTFAVSVAGALSATSGSSRATWNVSADLGGGAFDLRRTGSFYSPELPNSGYVGDPFGTYQATIAFGYGMPLPLYVELDGSVSVGYTANGPGNASYGSPLILRWEGISNVTVNGTPVPNFTVTSDSGTPWADPINVCPADFNGDGFLDFFDYDDFVTAFETGTGDADFNNDGFVDFFDYDDFVAAFEAGC
jgi:hypothetical protein